MRNGAIDSEVRGERSRTKPASFKVLRFLFRLPVRPADGTDRLRDTGHTAPQQTPLSARCHRRVLRAARPSGTHCPWLAGPAEEHGPSASERTRTWAEEVGTSGAPSWKAMRLGTQL